MRPALNSLKALVLIGFVVLGSSKKSEAQSPANVEMTDRFGGPLLASDIFPSTLSPFHPLNPADLAHSHESLLEFGMEPDGKSLILGLPNFLFSIADQNLKWGESEAAAVAFDAKKYELGYGISTTDIGWSQNGELSAALGFHLRYLEFQNSNNPGSTSANWAYPDLGMSVWYRNFRVDAVILNLTPLVEASQGAPGHQPREYNFGVAYAVDENWLAFGRVGIQDTSKRQTFIDAGIEKKFFESITFRLATQRVYATSNDAAAKETRSSLSGGLIYRLNIFGKGYRYPENDRDLFSLQTLSRVLQNIQLGMNVMLTRIPEDDNRSSNDKTSVIVTLGKAF